MVVSGCSSPSETGTSDGGIGGETDPASPQASAPIDAGAASASEAGQDPGSNDSGVELPTPPSGYLVWVSAVEPAHLHYDDLPSTITAQIRQGLLEGLFGVDSSISYYPELLAGEPEISKDNRNQVTINYRLRDGLTWSDGESLTANDVAYTYRILAEGCRTEADGSILDGDNSGCVYLAQSRLGYDRISSFEVASDTEFTIQMSGFYPGWRDLFSQVFAAHAYGETAAEVNDRLTSFVGPDGPLPTSGPLTVEQWDRGQRLLLKANDEYSGSVSPDQGDAPTTVDGVQISFVSSPEAAVEAVANGDGDLTIVPMESKFVDLASGEVAITAWPGPNYEHLGMNLLNPHLASAEVREAIATAVDKEAIVAEVYDPIVPGVLPPLGLGNTYWVTNQSPYKDHQSLLGKGDAEGARARLATDGYTAGRDGVMTHPDRGRLRLRIATAENDALRVAQQALIMAQLEAAGFMIEPHNVPGGDFVTKIVFSEASLDAATSGGTRGDKDLWDLALFGWAPGPWPGGQSGAYRAGSRFNPYGYANPSFDAKANECDAEPDDAKRAACYNELDVMVTTLDDEGTQGLFVVPLSQRPPVVFYNTDRLSTIGPVPPVADGGPLVNIYGHKLADG